MTWEALIQETAQRGKLSPSETERMLNAFFDTVMDSMKTESCVMFRPDFGCFEMRAVGGETHPGEQNLPKNRRTPVFKKSAALKKQLRQSDEAYLRMLRETGRDAQADRLERKLSGQS